MAAPTDSPPSQGPAALPLLQIERVRQAFPKAGGGELLVLEDVDLSLAEGEIVALLGRSGSGKSTLLRLIAGLARPVSGEVRYRGRPVTGPLDGIAMVFQSFALFPWLTVLENVEIGLEARGVGRAARRRRALEAIDLIGLDGFESAYPRELSGGMRQRVGLARALVVEPAVLMLDESFSALDVLTAENLRSDLVELWSEGRLPIRGVLMVTHSIEEAVSMADRAVVLSSNPGRLVREIAIDLPRPRDRYDPRFRALVETIYVEMTSRLAGPDARGAQPRRQQGLETELPQVSAGRLAGLIEEIAAPAHGGRADLPELARRLNLHSDELFRVAECLELLDFARLEGGDIVLTEAGGIFAEAELDDRKALFRSHLLRHLALAERIRQVLDERPSHAAPWTRFSDELEDVMSAEAARRTLNTVIGWGRFAELFAYDAGRELFSLEDREG